jgi:DNA mismatch repair ATPase MutS
MNKYLDLKEENLTARNNLKRIHSKISLLRLATAILFFVSCYYKFKGENNFEIVILSTIIVFILLMRKHRKVASEIELRNTLITINENEINYLSKGEIEFDNGLEYNDTTHSYSHDLDIFGDKSLFQCINRTATFIGKTRLSKLLLSLLSNEKIIENQIAIKELKNSLEWRQKINALSIIANDSKDSYQNLIDWSAIKTEPQSKLFIGLSFIIPALLILSLITFAFTKEPIYWSLFVTLFLVNLVILVFQLKKIKLEIFKSDKMHDIIMKYSLIIEEIENKQFQSSKLNELKNELINSNVKSSENISKLSSLFNRMDSIKNGMGAIIFNGFLLYHIHTLRALFYWRKDNAKFIKIWLDVIGEFETMNSLANFAYNNQEFIFPELNKDKSISLKDLGHPLIPSIKRICNSVDFSKHKFIILTGSNMSGKSTFLRTLGINMVLAGIGAPICSSKASVHPMRVWVSMRLSDSLNDNESYFFAEIKRLKEVIEAIKEESCFVLLDEILRGTNSDDKRNGTIEVIKKMIPNNVIGAIATHDLEVCETTKLFPEFLANKCFEVEIVNDELVFDFKLREGICRNKSATFLMKKMEII